ncbi:MAG TPA: VWA domain-containing protein [Bryobacteraceae bacterium]|nr:VWA domain-containing protein [Bryobacteraceae bacterium]
MRLTRGLPVLILLSSFAFAAPNDESAIKRRPKVREVPTFRADSNLVLVPVTVLDRKGAVVEGLSAESFVVLQDSAPQKIASFGEQDIPVSVGIVLDTSGSMQRSIGRAKDALRAFIGRANPADEMGLLTVSTRPGEDFGFTSDLNSIPERLLTTGAGGSTALIDTIYAAIQQSRSAHNGRRALFVISDGMDNHSRYSKAELMSAALEADLQIYCLSIYDPPLTRKPIELQEERSGVALLEELARRTGGVALVAHGEGDISRAAARIGRIMRDQYLIGYLPEGVDNSGKWHSIQVTLKPSGVKAWARSGFYGH